jgi:hypothetical protein
MTKKEKVLSFVKPVNGEISKFTAQQNLMAKLYPREEMFYGQDPLIDDYNLSLEHLNHFASWDWPDSTIDKAFIAMNKFNLSIDLITERYENNEKFGTKSLSSKIINNIYESLR